MPGTNRTRSVGRVIRAPVSMTATVAVVILAVAPNAIAADEQAFVRTASASGLQWGPCPDFMPESCAIAVLHGDPSKPAADIFFRLPAGERVPLHWHTSAERMVLVSGTMEVAYEGQAPVTLEAGNYAYGPPRAKHHASCVSGEDCVLFIAFEEPVDAVPAAP